MLSFEECIKELQKISKAKRQRIVEFNRLKIGVTNFLRTNGTLGSIDLEMLKDRFGWLSEKDESVLADFVEFFNKLVVEEEQAQDYEVGRYPTQEYTPETVGYAAKSHKPTKRRRRR